MKLTLNRTFCLVSLTGHAIGFEKGVPIDVPACMVHEALAIGAVADEQMAAPEEIKTVHELNPVVRDAEITRAFDIIVERAARGDFTAAGRPHAKAVNKIVGYDTDATERDRLWDARTLAQGA